MKRRNSILFISFLLYSIPFAETDHWYGWLGENKTGHVNDFIPPKKWPQSLTQKWSISIGSGYGTPILKDNEIFTHTRKNDQEYIACVNKESGKIKWSKMYEAPFKMGGGGEKHGKGPKASPVYSDGTLYTFGISGILSAWNTEDGEKLWSKTPGLSFGQPYAHWGVSNSPLVINNKLISLFGNDQKGALIALDKDSGDTLWTLPCGGTCYSSPTIGTIGGILQVVVLHHESLIGVDPHSGELLWEFPFPHKTHNQNMPTPVVHQGKVLFGGENRGVFCIEPKLKNGNWTLHKPWIQKDVALNMASPLISNHLLFGLSHYGLGRLFCINPKTGKILWQGPPRTAQNAMFLSFRDHVLALTNNGNVKIYLNSENAFQIVANYKVSDTQTWAPPVLLKQGLLIKNSQNLTLWNF
jgi:outer membrane protein assembly factor BamB